jgi:hypothetical protein
MAVAAVEEFLDGEDVIGTGSAFDDYRLVPALRESIGQGSRHRIGRSACAGSYDPYSAFRPARGLNRRDQGEAGEQKSCPACASQFVELGHGLLLWRLHSSSCAVGVARHPAGRVLRLPRRRG